MSQKGKEYAQRTIALLQEPYDELFALELALELEKIYDDHIDRLRKGGHNASKEEGL